MSLLQELLQLNEETQGLGDKSYYKVKKIRETENGKRIQFTGYKKRNGKFVNVGEFTAKKGTPDDELWKEIDDHFTKFDDGAED